MTIKELCNNQEHCISCPFHDACYLISCTTPYGYVDDDDKSVTKSIIETAKLLQEEK